MLAASAVLAAGEKGSNVKDFNISLNGIVWDFEYIGILQCLGNGNNYVTSHQCFLLKYFPFFAV